MLSCICAETAPTQWKKKGERERKEERGLGEKEMGKEPRLLTDGCQRGAEVLLSPVGAPVVCECL